MLDEILEYFRPSRQKRHATQQRQHLLSGHRKQQPVKRRTQHQAPAKKLPTKQQQQNYYRQQKDWERKGFWQIMTEPTEINMFLALLFLGMLVTIVFFHPHVFNYPRWQVMMDLNRDGMFTVTDLFFWCFWLFYLPGDVVISVLMQLPGPTAFFELRGDSFGGIGSLMMSSLYWWLMGGGPMLLAGMAPIFIQTFLRS